MLIRFLSQKKISPVSIPQLGLRLGPPRVPSVPPSLTRSRSGYEFFDPISRRAGGGMTEEEKGVPSSSSSSPPPDTAAADAPANDTAVTSSDVKESQKLLGTVNWGAATIVGVFAGLLYGGSKEASASVSKDAVVMLKLGSTPDKREQYRIMRDAMEKRFIRVARGSFVGGVRLGMFTAAFYGLQSLLAEKRGVHDVCNVVGAGSATAATFGLIMPGSPMWRARNALLGSILGAGICFPLGWVHLKLMEKANEEISKSKSAHLDETEKKNITRAGAAIERLEEHLRR